MNNAIVDPVLRSIGNEIDITKTEFDAIVSAYQEVGNWLAAPYSETQKYDFLIYPQGSVKIGTVIKPLKGDDYDVDIVCLFQKNHSTLARKDVKQIVGKRLHESAKYNGMLEEEHGRCWTLDFRASPKFHMDILPATPMPIGGESVNATKKDDNGNYSDLPTNPKGFAEWFLKIAGSYKKPVTYAAESKEPVPSFPEKTPLQIAVQLIKRHRDYYFLNLTDKIQPASIIINTLMAETYQGQYSLLDILTTCPVHWSEKIQGYFGHYCLENPSLPKENFMDKWNHDDKNASKDFFEWLGILIRDIGELASATSTGKMTQILKRMFGIGTLDKVVNSNQLFSEEINQNYSISKNPSLTDTASFTSCQNLQCPYASDPGAKIAVNVTAMDEDGKIIASFSDTSPQLPKGTRLIFKAIVSGVHDFNYKVIWQITNTGKEAEGNFRGGFENSDNEYQCVRHEHTSYHGTHFVQAFVIRHGVCIAKSGLILINVGSDSL